jgi:hypothetical protein
MNKDYGDRRMVILALLLSAILLTSQRDTMVLAATNQPFIPSEKSKPSAATLPAKTADSQTLTKFALLVGINLYAHAAPLQGATHDAQRMREVLLKKFAFPEKNILTLTDQYATRQAILEAFKNHLLENAKKNRNAIIVFHYSGHGSQVEDDDGDEADGLDETLMPYDSRDKENQHFDIIDDELNELFADLSQHTANITFILDSCHSGTATRGDAEMLAREFPKDTRPQPKRKRGVMSRGNDKKTDSQTNDFLAGSQSYVTISGCLPFQKAFEKDARKGEEKNGYLTYYLVKALWRAKPETTYRELMEEVATAVSKAQPKQSPQLEGDLRRTLFAGTAVREDPFIKIEKVQANRVTLQAGAVQGIREGTVIAIYAPDAQNLIGEEKKIANAVVINVQPFSAIAELPDAKANVKISQVSTKAKAILIAPNLGLSALRVALDSTAGSGGAESQNSVEAAVAQLLTDSKLVEVVNTVSSRDGASAGNANWDVKLRRGKFGAVFTDQDASALVTEKEDEKLPSDNQDVYYLDTGSGEPLFGFFIKTTHMAAAEKITRALEAFAKQRNLLTLGNAASSLNNGIKVSVVRVEGKLTKGPDGKVKGQREYLLSAPENQTNYFFEQGVQFKLRLENQSAQDLYLTVINISTDGAINIMYPQAGARDPLRKGRSIETIYYETAAPAGLDTYKIIATTQYTDFSFLAEEAIRRSAQSPLEWLLSQAAKATRGKGVAADNLKLNTWGTRQIQFVVGKKKL